ncbi:uncharacterized protein LOC123516302 isoform X3 [Portunus trituberculatus]|uniref:uncharacterized protein LOC123516302 isoform X3 n=1 Tax=Portunus trituberculatus TaxID=210409 RepID=UPI001E1CD6C8|nr:uncharacterized protein LOC123516302 isoform X3 [Portunus trituberculatus]
MLRSHESLLLTFAGTMPALVMLVVFFNNQSFGSEGFSFLVVISVVCACISILIARIRLLGGKASEAHTQTEDVESGQGDASSEDAPPIYETVVAKPPPYDSLYESCNLPVCGGDDEEAEPGVSDGSKDSDLPTYTQAAQALTPV